jgi:histidine ammonia-lyase
MILLERHDQLDLPAYLRVAFGGERVALAPDRLAAIASSRARLLDLVASGEPAYGVNTGLGYLSRHAVAPSDQAAYQRAILAGRAAAIGPALSEAVVRGALLLRLTGFLSGYAGVSAELCQALADALNDGWCPAVPAAVTGAAGEIVPLAHMFSAFVAERRVELGAKEGLALINGAPLAPAVAIPLALRAEALVLHATLAGTFQVAVTRASVRPYSARIGRLKGDPGQQRVHELMEAWLAGDLWSPHAVQAAVSLRVIPQVHGAALDELAHLHAQLSRELRAVTDSPLFLPECGAEPAGLYPSGNFHAQAVTLRLAALGVALAQVVNLVEKRLHRLLDTRFSGLPEQLARDPGLQSGLTILHKQVIGLAAEARSLATPAILNVGDSSSGQEDVQAHTLLAAFQLDRIAANLELALAYELVALRHARDLRAEPLPRALEVAILPVVELVDEIDEDRSLATDVERVRDLVASGRMLPDAPRWEPLLADDRAAAAARGSP